MSRGRKVWKREPVAVMLTDMAHRGPGGGPYRRQVVFAFHGIPGESVLVQLERRRKKYLHGRVVEVLEPSSDRVAPRCPYYGVCGGCQWQHIEYAAQLRLKQQVVEEHFARWASNLLALTPCIRPSHLGSTATAARLLFRARPASRQRGSRRVVEIEHCEISHPLISQLLATLNAMIRDGRIPDFWGRNWVETRVIPRGEEARLASFWRVCAMLTWKRNRNCERL